MKSLMATSWRIRSRSPRVGERREKAEHGDGEKKTFAKRYKPSTNPHKWIKCRDVYQSFIQEKVHTHIAVEDVRLL